MPASSRHGSTALSGVEHLSLPLGKESISLALIRHFGLLKALSRASFNRPITSGLDHINANSHFLSG
jgi:hypothetical protein